MSSAKEAPDWSDGWAHHKQRCSCGARLVKVSGWGHATLACSVSGWGITHEPPCTGIADLEVSP